jgi:hypothetical protein
MEAWYVVGRRASGAPRGEPALDEPSEAVSGA